MAIHIDVFTELNERKLRRDADKLKREYEQAGVAAGTSFGKGVDRAARNIEKAHEAIRTSLEGIQRAREREATAIEKTTRAGRAWSASRAEVKKRTEELTKAQDALNDAVNKGVTDAEKMTRLENAAARAKESHAKATTALVNSSQGLRQSRRDQGAASRAVVASIDTERRAHRDLIRARQESDSAFMDSARNIRNAGQSMNDMIQTIGTTAFKTTRGLATFAAPVALYALVELAQTATTASQSILLLPAAVTTAGAAFGTLKLATMGFSEAMENLGDPEKFATALQKMAPNAQQAALSIQGLTPEIDKLRNATENSFFDGFGEQFHNLANEFLPEIQQLTVGIAGAFNDMFMNVTNQLMTPESMTMIDGIIANLQLTFQNLVPVAGSLSQAFLDLTSVGMELMPGVASDIAGAAASFANFISEARQSGELKVWMRDGIDAVKALGDMVWTLGEIFFTVFGGEGQEGIAQFKGDVQGLQDVIGLLALDTETWSRMWHQEMSSMTGPLAALRDGIMDIPEALNWVGDRFVDFGNVIITALNGPIDAINAVMTGSTKLLNLLPGEDKPEDFGHISKIPKIEYKGVPTNDWGGYEAPLPVPSNNDYGNGREQRGLPPYVAPGSPTAGLGPYSERPVPMPTGDKPSEKDVRDGIIAGLDPALWRVDPFAGMPAGSGLPPGAPGAAPMTYGVDPQDVIEDQRNVLSAAHDLEEDRKRRLALERDNTATAQEIEKAKWDELEGTWKLQEQQAKLIDRMKGTTSKAAKGMDDLGVALDPDLGLSQGLSGFADNLTRMVGNMIAAPMMKDLQAVVDADPIKGGFGLLGIMGAQNIAAGKSPLLGRDMPAGVDVSGASSATSSPMGMVAGPGIMAAPGTSGREFAQGQMMPYWKSQGFEVGDHAADSHGEHQNGAIDIMVDSIEQGNAVLAQVLADPNTYGAIFNQTQYGYGNGPNGTPMEDRGSPTQNHMDHVHAFYKPGNKDNINPDGTPMAMPGTSGSTAGFSPGMSGATPVFVVNMPGGGMGAGGGIASFFGGGPGGAKGAAPAITSAAGTFWDAIAEKEASGNWANADTGNNGHYGGLQFSPSTWNQFGGQEFAPMPHQATREQQIAVADRTAFTGYGNSKPQGLGAWEVLTNGPGGSSSVPGISVNSPRPGGTPPLPDLSQMFGGGGEGPIFTKPQPPPNVSAGQPPGSTGLPSILGAGGIAAPPALGEYGPPSVPGTAAPGSIGPFPVPPSVAALGSSAGMGGPLMAPNIGPTPIQPGGFTPGGAGAMAGTQIGAATASPGVAMGGAGGIGASDSTMALAGMAASALDVMAPGAGQAAQIGMKLANRAIQYGGQLAGIGVSGLMETFLPTGGSELANSGWIPRIVGGLAGAKPALPNVAGGKPGGNGQPPPAQPPLAPGQVTNGGAGAPAKEGANINVEYNNNGATEDRAGADLTHHLGKMYGG